MKMRIGYDGKFLSYGQSIGSRSGHGIHASNLLTEMLDCWPDGSFTVFALDGDPRFGRRDNCEVVEMPRLARSSVLRNVVAFPVELARHPVDVLLAFSTLPVYAPCKTVLLLADVFWLANPGWLPRHMAIPRTLALRRSSQRADRIVTTTEFSRQEICRLLAVPAEKVVVVPHGVRTRLAERLPASSLAAFLARHNLTERYILSLNDLHPRKNLDGLVAAYELLRSRTGLSHHLVIAGRNLWPYPELLQRIQRSPFGRDIKLLGYVASDDIPALYQAAELFVYPSFYEGWGLQVHEAMMAGVPLAIANNSSMPEIAGDAAELFDPYDIDQISRSMERVLTDAAFSATLIARGHERVKEYSWRQAAEATLAVCAEVAAE